ncbi:MAG: lipoyl synthase [Candidatus Schekmanbacteria bacterium RIFCSPHIGHO2_02_FULL_38_11]|nr:MAG: lipoyl synthase [Candidatus Schekmanbacteria bacterium GWA2_38_9]OGL51668.1 MAG: lipoyl synthase [Candidatus Schekmanbacteria bacterium RIFCSPHIGHO2_02_FULL_38_11]
MKRNVPNWLVKRGFDISQLHDVKTLLRKKGLHTVCEEARCPNIGECFKKPTATFMIMGNTCTRSCRFCAVTRGTPEQLVKEEPLRIAEAVKEMKLKHVVVTSVTRDDLSDGGASHFARTVEEIRKLNSNVAIEVLIPDFKGSSESLSKVCKSEPDIINHNLETVPRLYRDIRPEADYLRSLDLIKKVKDLFSGALTKSGIMVGLGETKKEVVSVLEDLRNFNCDMVTIGQYLSPEKDSFPVQEYVPPDTFEYYRKTGEMMGFKNIASAPFVRSSYMAEEQML